MRHHTPNELREFYLPELQAMWLKTGNRLDGHNKEDLVQSIYRYSLKKQHQSRQKNALAICKKPANTKSLMKKQKVKAHCITDTKALILYPNGTVRIEHSKKYNI